MNIKGIWHPEAFQGRHKGKNYFEGWYYKLIDPSRKNVIAIIPGISMGSSGHERHAFIQFIDAMTGETEYFRFSYEDFHADPKVFNIRIGNNYFSDRTIKLDLKNERTQITAMLSFDHIIKYPKRFISPGIMGPFSFIPWMECYHGIVNIRHTIRGSLNINGVEIKMTEGEGYIEKDWGRSFPDSWIWIQANHFEVPETSFMFSLARIPWLGRSFTGLIAFLKIQDKFIKFATYNGSSIQDIHFEEDILNVTLKNSKYTLEFSARYHSGGILKAPKNGLMDRDIEESITSEVDLNLSDKHGKTVYNGNSKLSGMEISGTLADII